MRKLFILFTFLCVSVVGFATDYCHSEMTAGGKTIYLTCQQISAGNYQLKVECNEAMSGLGGSFCEVNGVGGYQLNAAGHFDLSADGKTITCDIASSTAPRVYTPLYVLIDGEKNFGDVSDASWAECAGGGGGGGSTPEGEIFVPANASLNSTYIAPGWVEDAASEATFTYNSTTGVISGTILNTLNEKWQGQIKFNHGVTFSADKYYDFSIKLHATKGIGGVTIKVDDNNGMLLEDASVVLPADLDYVYTKTDVAGVAGGNGIMVFDFGWSPANTDITISEISIIEKDAPSAPIVVPDPNDYTAGGHTIHLDASYVGDIYTLVITSADDMQGLGGSFWNVNGVGTDMRSNSGTNSYTVSGDKKTITCQVQSSSAPNIYTPLYVLMPGEVNFGSITLNWENRGPINSEYCNYQGSETRSGDTYVTLTWETDPSGNVVITMGNGTGASSCSFRNGGFEGGINAFVVSDDDFATTTPASDYFTAVQVYSGNTYTLTKTADLPANAKIKHVGSGNAFSWTVNGNSAWGNPDFIYTYGGICNQLDAPANVSIDANNIITFDDVTDADSYTAYVSLSGVVKYSQAVASGDELTFTPLVDGDYDVTVVASGTGKTDSDPSSAFVWSLTAAPIVLGNSEYCEHIMQTGTNTEAAFTWETDGSGNIVITISEALGGAADATHFRATGLALANFKVGSAKTEASVYFNHSGETTGNQITLSLKDPAVAPGLGEKIYYNAIVTYATSLDGNAWPTLNFEYTYGTECSGIAVSATPNDNTMGTAVVQKAGVDVDNVEDGDEVTFIATSNDAELYRFVNWTKAGSVVSSNATYVTTITETTNLVANFEYIRNVYCHSEINSIQNKKLYLTLGSIGGGKYQIKFEGSAEAQLTGLNNANYTINWVTTDIADGDKKMSGQDVPFNNARWAFDASGYGSATATFGIAEGHTWEDIYAWNHAIYFSTAAGEVGYTGFPGRNNIDWTATCADAEAPVFAKAEAAVIDGSSVRLTIQASDNWEGMLTYTIARESADPIISNHASGEEFTQDVSGLTAGTEYTFTVSVSDGVNVTNQNIVVTPEADTQVPVMDAASLDSKTWNSAIINVAATDNLGVASFFIVELDADFVASEGKISVDGLTQGTAYGFTIKAKDGAGNLSENSASVNFTTDAHLTAPTSAADAPTWPAAQVKAVYSQTYNADCNFGYWESGTAYAQETYGKKFTTAGGGYFGLEFVNHLNCINMVKLHFDIWIENDASIGIVPIWGGADVRAFADLTGQQWNSVDLTLTSDFSAVSNWSDVYQIKIDNAPNLTFWIGNVFFYRETPLADSEAPTNVSVSVAKESFQTVTLTVQAEDNSDAVNFRVMNGDDEVATGAAATATATTIVVNNLTPGTNYNFNVIAYDDANNEAAPEAIASTTKALPASAPTPDVTGKNVIPVFSDVITGGPATIHSGGWGETTYPQWFELTESDKVFYAQNFNWAGWHSWGAAIDASKMQYIHLDIYSIGMTQISFTPISTGPKEGVYNITLTPNTWTSVDIPLSEYPATIDMGDVFQFKFMNPVGDNEFMADNVYFWAPVPAKEVIRDGLSNGKWGTICPKQTVEEVEGATFYQISYLEEQGGQPYNMVFDEIAGTTLTAGQPYFFIATGDEIRGNKTGAELSEAGAGVNGFYGYIGMSPMELPYAVDYNPAGNNTFVIYNNCVYRINGTTSLKSERCYININATEPSRTPKSAAPGRRRITMGVQNTETATGLDELNASETPLKVVVNGQFFILRGEKMYDATGRLVK